MHKHSVASLIASGIIDRLQAKMILRHTLKLNAAQLISASQRMLNDGEVQQFMRLAESVRNGEPINYLLGYKEFYSREFKVSRDTLIPRPETELMVDVLLQMVKPGQQLLDLGTGSGCIAITLKLEAPGIKVEAVDKFASVIAVAADNAQALNADVNFYVSDWFGSVNGQYDFIVSNPPYIAADDRHLADLGFEPQTALTDFNDGLDCLRHIVGHASAYLRYAGYLVVEHGFNQGAAVRDMYNNHGFTEIKTICDYANHERITLGKWMSNASH